MSQDTPQEATPGRSDVQEPERRKFLEGFGKAGMVALPFAAMMLSSRTALAQSGVVLPPPE